MLYFLFAISEKGAPTDIILNDLNNPELDVEFLAREMYMSRATLYRKISEICNLSPNELIKIKRLKKAAKLLTEGKHKMYEISDMVGFTSQHHSEDASLSSST